MPVQSLCCNLQLLTMPTPSLILVPARFKTGKLYTPLATTSGGTVLGASGDFNVTRALDTATRVNASGNIEVVASGIPRLDYYTSGGTAGCPALLVEPSAQNVVVQSQNWLASGWRSDVSGNVTTVSATTGTLDPLGTNTANAISPTSGNLGHFKVGSDGTINYTSGTIYTFSAFFKQGTGSAGRYVQLTSPAAPFTQQFYANFDLQLGTIAATGSVSADSNRAASIQNFGNGWYRCRVTATCNGTFTSVGLVASLITASGDTRSPSFAGTTTDILYGWGAQTETGSVATSYIPTTTAAVTRNADVISLSGAVSGCIGQTEGTIYAEFINTFSSSYNDGLLIRVFADANNEVFGRKEAASNRYTFRWRANSQNTTFTNVNVPDGVNKVALAYKSGDTALFLNGVQVGSTSTDVRAFSVNPTTVALGSNGGAGQFFNDRIRAAALYTTRLTNAELAALTSP
jgi:hypothetical protein